MPDLIFGLIALAAFVVMALILSDPWDSNSRM